jgi:hypothetical protein
MAPYSEKQDMKLLSTGNPKILKGTSQGFNTYILHLAPANVSGYETCPKRTAGCTAACLNTAGRGGMYKKGESTNVIQEARKRKTRFFFENRTEFMRLLVADIELAIKQCQRMAERDNTLARTDPSFEPKKALIPVFRLNGTSDLAWEKYPVIRGGVEYANIFLAFPNVQFYDYTKVLGRKVKAIANYHLTFSAADGNDDDVNKAIQQGYNIATVFGIKKTLPMPETYKGLPVFNGDDSDLRFLDPKGVVVGLYAKGKAKKDTSGFVKFPIMMMKVA